MEPAGDEIEQEMLPTPEVIPMPNTENEPVKEIEHVHHAPKAEEMVIEFEDELTKSLEDDHKKSDDELKTSFDEMVDAEGNVTKDDVERHWQKKGKNPTPANVKEVLTKVEMKDHEGSSINFDEFVKIEDEAKQHSFYTCDPKADLESALKFFDKNDDGSIDIDELRDILTGYDDAELEELIKAADTDGNGSLSIEEISKYLMENLGIDAKALTE